MLSRDRALYKPYMDRSTSKKGHVHSRRPSYRHQGEFIFHLSASFCILIDSAVEINRRSSKCRRQTEKWFDRETLQWMEKEGEEWFYSMIYVLFQKFKMTLLIPMRIVLISKTQPSTVYPPPRMEVTAFCFFHLLPFQANRTTQQNNSSPSTPQTGGPSLFPLFPSQSQNHGKNHLKMR